MNVGKHVGVLKHRDGGLRIEENPVLVVDSWGT